MKVVSAGTLGLMLERAARTRPCFITPHFFANTNYRVIKLTWRKTMSGTVLRKVSTMSTLYLGVTPNTPLPLMLMVTAEISIRLDTYLVSEELLLLLILLFLTFFDGGSIWDSLVPFRGVRGLGGLFDKLFAAWDWGGLTLDLPILIGNYVKNFCDFTIDFESLLSEWHTKHTKRWLCVCCGVLTIWIKNL